MFVIDSIKVLFKKSPKALLFGDHALLKLNEKQLIADIADGNRNSYSGLRTGEFDRADLVHKGAGKAYLLGNPTNDQESLLIFGDDFRVTNGPDLYPYLITSENPKDSIGEHIILGDLRGTRGGQSYVIARPISELVDFTHAAIYCKQFEVLFSAAKLK